MEEQKTQESSEKSFFGIIVHSFFVIPFLIAVFTILLFTAVSLLTRENHTVYDLLENIKTGGVAKRWQSAFELSKILSNAEAVPEDAQFSAELIKDFEQSYFDTDTRV